MAPNQAPRQAIPWRDAHTFFLLSPLMGFLSRAWSRLRGPGPPESWLVEAVTGAHQVEAGPAGEAEASLVTHPAPWVRHPPEKTEDSGAAEEDGDADWGACPDPKFANSLLETWGLSDDGDAEYEEEAASVAREQESKLTDGQPASPSHSLLMVTLQHPPGEEEDEEATEDDGLAEDKEMTKAFSYPPSPDPRFWECCSGVEEEDKDGEAVKKGAAGTFTSLLPSHSKPNAWVYCPEEVKEEEKDEEQRDTEEGSPEKIKTSISPSSSESNPRAWENGSKEKDEKVNEVAEKGDTDPESHSSILVQRSLLRAWEYQPSKNTEEEDEREDEENASEVAEEEGEAKGPSSIPPTNAFLRPWVYHRGEDTEEDEEEDEDSDSGTAEEEGEAEGPSSFPPTSAFLRAWVYHPGEDTEEDEDSDSGAAEEEGEAEGPSSIPPTSAFLRAWVYHPGEDTEEDEDSDSGTAEEEGEAEGPSSFPSTSAFLRAWVYHPGEDTEEDEEDEDSDSGAAEEEVEAENTASIPPMSTFQRAWVYHPGEDTKEEENADKDDSEAAEGGEAADAEPGPSLQAQTTLLRTQIYRPGEDTGEKGAAEEWGETEPHPFPVAIYLPGEKPPPPWVPPRLPLRLQRRLKSSETPTWNPDPETPLKARKVRFSENVTVHILAVWAGPARAARRGPWEQLARDRSRFARRIAQTQEKLGPCLTPAARARAWARLGSPPTSPTQTEPSTSVQATPLSPAVVAPAPSPACACLSPCLGLSGRRG